MDLIQERLRTFVTDNFLFGQDEGELLADDSLGSKRERVSEPLPESYRAAFLAIDD